MIYQTLREKKFDTLRQKLLETQNTTSLLQFSRLDLHIMSLTLNVGFSNDSYDYQLE